LCCVGWVSRRRELSPSDVMLGWAFHLNGRLIKMTLDDAIATLYAREINCGCETFWDGGIKVWIGDTMNGHHAETMFSRDDMGRAGQWLVDEAARLYPTAFQ
jgi:hypothetical protein